MNIKDCVPGMAVRLAGDRKDDKGRPRQIHGLLKQVFPATGLVTVGFGYYSRSDFEWKNPKDLEPLPKFQLPRLSAAKAKAQTGEGKIMVAAMTPANELLALGCCGDAVMHKAYGRYAKDYDVPSDVSWGISSDHREVARWLGYRTVQVRVVVADRDTIELVICYDAEAPYEELSGPWHVDEN